MKTKLCCATGLFASLILSVCFVSPVVADEVKIFNGKDFSNWHGRETTDPAKYASIGEEQKAKWAQEIKDHWRIEDGVIVSDGKGAYLSTNQEFGDFDFSFDYLIVAGCD